MSAAPRSWWRRSLVVFASAALVTLGLAGCGDDDDDGGDDDGATIDATLSDFEIDLSSSSASAGEVTFEITNEGPAIHEFVVFETDLAPDDLPTDDDGNVAESEDFDPVDEVEDIDPDTDASLTVDLAAGHHVIICNIPGHYAQGMRTELDVS